MQHGGECLLPERHEARHSRAARVRRAVQGRDLEEARRGVAPVGEDRLAQETRDCRDGAVGVRFDPPQTGGKSSCRDVLVRGVDETTQEGAYIRWRAPPARHRRESSAGHPPNHNHCQPVGKRERCVDCSLANTQSVRSCTSKHERCRNSTRNKPIRYRSVTDASVDVSAVCARRALVFCFSTTKETRPSPVALCAATSNTVAGSSDWVDWSFLNHCVRGGVGRQRVPAFHFTKFLSLRRDFTCNLIEKDIF